MNDFSAGEADIIIDSGDNEVFELTREDNSGNAKDISGYEFWLTVKDNIDTPDSEASVQKNVTTHKDAVNGITEFNFAPADTEDLSGSYYWDIQEKTDAGSINTLVRGKFLIRPDVTEAT